MKRKNTAKIIISLALSLVMLCSIPIPAFAAVKEEATITPQWTSIFTMDVDIAFLGSLGNASATARKQSTASHIVGTLYVYKKVGSSWVYIDEVSGSKTVGTLGLTIDFECEKGVQYKAVLTVVAYTNDIGESETISLLRTCQ